MTTLKINPNAPERDETIENILMFVIQYFPVDMKSLQALLVLSGRFNSKVKLNSLLWVALAKRKSLGCQACFLEARDSAQYSSSPSAHYWREVTTILVAAESLRRQWRIQAAHRTFVNITAGDDAKHTMRKVKCQPPVPLSASTLHRSGHSSLVRKFLDWLNLRSRAPAPPQPSPFPFPGPSLSRCLSWPPSSKSCYTAEDSDNYTENERSSDGSIGETVGFEYVYVGKSIPLILDLFLQQEVLQLLPPSSRSPQHAHCLSSYPPHWQTTLLRESARTCFTVDALHHIPENMAVGACRCSPWQEVDASCLPYSSCVPPVISLSRHNRHPFARWVVLQLWRAAGGQGDESCRVRLFATRIAMRNISTEESSEQISSSERTPEATMQVKEVSSVDYPSARLLVAAVNFSQEGGLVRVAGVCCGGHRLLDESLCDMLKIKIGAI